MSVTRELLYLRDENAALRRTVDAQRAGLRSVAGFLRGLQRAIVSLQMVVDQVEDMIDEDSFMRSREEMDR
jgi:hypothetical protein